MAPLQGYRVIDLSGGIAGGYCTKLLADGGAEVIKIEPPEGDPLRAWSASGATIPADGDGALFSFLACSKQSVVADPTRTDDLESVATLIEAADAVVWSPGSRLSVLPSLAPPALRAEHRHLVVTTITPFGLDSPWTDRPATEFTLQAWAGAIVGLGRGSADRAPVFVGGQVGEWLAGSYAAIGTMVARQRGIQSGPGELVDVSMLEALILGLTYYPVTFHDMAGRPFRSGRMRATPGVAAAKDGLIGVGVGTGQQWLDFCVMVGHSEWMDEPLYLQYTQRASLMPIIEEWTRSYTVAEIVEAATDFRIPHAPVGNGATIPSIEHFQARRSLIPNPRDDFWQPAQPYRFQPDLLLPAEPPPQLGEHTVTTRRAARASSKVTSTPSESGELPFRGLRILDLTAFWAGPLCTHMLALLGAEVIHIESTTRPDGTRALSGMSDDHWWERSGIFSGLNTNKRSVTLDLSTERGRDVLRQLIATCDVVVENYTPRVLDQLSLDYAAVRDIRSDIVMVRMPGFGLDGPWRDKAAFAFAIEDAAGLTWLTGYPDEHPHSPYCLGDPNAGIHAVMALLVALDHRRQTGEGVLVEAAMIDAALNIAAEQVVEFSAYGTLLARAGNRGPTAAPQNLYLTADIDESGQADCWVAIAVADDVQWTGLLRALGNPDWAEDPAIAGARGRAEHQDVIDEQLAKWCAGRSGDAIVERLWAAGVPVAKVLQPHHQSELPPLQARGFFEELDHPVAGPARYSTLPMRFSRGPQTLHTRHAPLLGEHSAEVLREVGLAEAAITSLETDGVTGRQPARRTI